MEKILQFLRKCTAPTNEELSQALARIVIVSVAIIYFLYHTHFHFDWVVNSLLAYLVFSLFHYHVAKRYPGTYKARILLVLFLDITITTVIIYATNEYGLFFYSLYLWYTIGYGVRFGLFYLLIAAFYGFVSFALIIQLSNYLQTIPYVSYGLLISIPVLAIFIAILLLRLQHVQQQLQMQLRHSEEIATTDALTQAPNRYALIQKLKSYQKAHHPITLFFVDLDGFKSVNDTFGHATGDALLAEVAMRLKLKELCNLDCSYGRLGGDEFALILETTNQEKIQHTAQQLLKQLSKPYLNGTVTKISASIGATITGEDFILEELLRRSDAAMYMAKKSGKNRFELNTC